VYWNTLSHLDAFCMGGLIPVMTLDHKVRRPVRILGVAALLAIMAGVFNFLLMDTTHRYITDLGYNHAEMRHDQHVWSYTLLNFLFASMILVLVSVRARHRMPTTRRLLETKWMMEIGKVSYGMYIFHWAFMTYVIGQAARPDRFVPALRGAGLFVLQAELQVLRVLFYQAEGKENDTCHLRLSL